jgi:hypothetical protein
MSNGMDDLAADAASEVDALFAAREAKLIAETTLNWERIKPELTDEAEYDRLMEAVGEATTRNESLGQLVERLKNIGAGGLALAEKVKKFVV